jgi:hypothetical protein
VNGMERMSQISTQIWESEDESDAESEVFSEVICKGKSITRRGTCRTK